MVNLAVIGRNFVVDWLLEAAACVEEIKPVAVYSRDLENGREFAEKWGLIHVFDRVEDLASCQEVDAVYIASPNYCHFWQSKLLLEAGKHVLCEKPATVNGRELEALLAIAREKNVVYLEAMRLVHDDLLDVIRAALPEIGPLRKVSFEFTQYSSRYDKVRAGETGVNAFDPSLSNGSIMDLGCYCVHAIARLFGKPSQVKAMGMKLENGFDGNGVILMQYPEFYAEATYSKVTMQVAPTYLLGEDGAILVDNLNRPKGAWIQLRNGQTRELPFAEKLPINMTCMLRNFCAMIRGDMDVAPWNEASRITAQVLDEARAQMGIHFPADQE